MKNTTNAQDLLAPISNGNVDFIRDWIDVGGDVNIKINGETPILHNAAKKGQLGIVKLLIEHNADIDCTDKYGETPILAALKAEKQEVVTFLLANNPNVNLTPHNSQSPLEFLIGEEKYDLAQLFLEHGARYDNISRINWLQLKVRVDLPQSRFEDVWPCEGEDTEVIKGLTGISRYLGVKFPIYDVHNETFIQWKIKLERLVYSSPQSKNIRECVFLDAVVFEMLDLARLTHIEAERTHTILKTPEDLRLFQVQLKKELAEEIDMFDSGLRSLLNEEIGPVPIDLLKSHASMAKEDDRTEKTVEFYTSEGKDKVSIIYGNLDYGLLLERMKENILFANQISDLVEHRCLILLPNNRIKEFQKLLENYRQYTATLSHDDIASTDPSVIQVVAEDTLPTELAGESDEI